MPSKYWIKLYHEILNDPKMGSLPDNLWRRTIELFLLAGELDKGGELLDTAGIAWTLRLSCNETLQKELQALQERNILTLQDNKIWFVTHFFERQKAVDVGDRVKKFREREKKKAESEQKNGVPGASGQKPSKKAKPVTKRYTDKDKDKDKESISPNGDNAPELQADSEKWDKTNKTIIGNKFLELTHLKPPSDEKTRGYWWGGLHELFKMGNKDPAETCRVMAAVVRYMQDENLTISSPKSLHNLARAVVSGQELKPKNGANNGHGAFRQDKKSSRAGKSTGRDLEREAVFDPYSGETIRPDG